MLRYIQGRALSNVPKLRRSMFMDRADQFKTRLGWRVSVDGRGFEQDEYDHGDTLYVIWELEDGTHGGSMRFLPTTGHTMANDHFGHLAGGDLIRDQNVWECTRFCLSRRASADVSAKLMLGGAEVGAYFGLSKALGVFDARMIRIYRQLDWCPVVIGSSSAGRSSVKLGLWTFSEETRLRLALRAHVDPEQSKDWLLQSLEPLKAAA
jgi:acyl homoserine lactone synthase